MKYLIIIMLILSTTVANAKVYPVRAPDYQDSDLVGLQVGDPSGGLYWYGIVLKTYESSETLNIEWHETGNTGIVDAFTDWDSMGADGTALCTINIVKPRDWNDVQVQADLGHEVLHCFGALHEGD